MIGQQSGLGPGHVYCLFEGLIPQMCRHRNLILGSRVGTETISLVYTAAKALGQQCHNQGTEAKCDVAHGLDSWSPICCNQNSMVVVKFDLASSRLFYMYIRLYCSWLNLLMTICDPPQENQA